MKVLQICSKPSYPPVDGGTMAMHQLSELLLQLGAELKILSFETPKHPFRSTIDDFTSKTQYECIRIDTNIKIADALINLLGKQSYQIQRFIHSHVNQRINQLLAESSYDIIILDSLFSAAYYDEIRRKAKGRIFLRAHNVEYIIWQNLAINENNPLKKWYFQLLAKRLKLFENNIINAVDGVLCISMADLEHFKKMNCRSPLHYVPFAAPKMAQHPCYAEKKQPSVYHLASMDWYPNEEAVRWFIQKVWPILKSRNTPIDIHLAGRKMPSYLVKYSQPGLYIHSHLEDVSSFINQHSILIVPLQSGSGVRIKIIEGLALGKAIISTSKGAEGLELTHGHNILIADTPEDFAQAIFDCIENIELHNKIAENALKFANENLSRQQIGKALSAILQIH